MSNIIALTLPVEEALERGILIRTPKKRPSPKRYTYFLETRDDEPWSAQGPFASRKEAKAFLMERVLSDAAIYPTRREEMKAVIENGFTFYGNGYRNGEWLYNPPSHRHEGERYGLLVTTKKPLDLNNADTRRKLEQEISRRIGEWYGQLEKLENAQ